MHRTPRVPGCEAGGQLASCRLCPKSQSGSFAHTHPSTSLLAIAFARTRHAHKHMNLCMQSCPCPHAHMHAHIHVTLMPTVHRCQRCFTPIFCSREAPGCAGLSDRLIEMGVGRDWVVRGLWLLSRADQRRAGDIARIAVGMQSCPCPHAHMHAHNHVTRMPTVHRCQRCPYAYFMDRCGARVRRSF